MKNQGVVKFFAIALVLVCIYQLSFTLKAISIEKDAEEEAAGDPVVKRKYLDSISAEKVYNLGLKDFTYLEVKERQLNLGLDLQGGMNVVMEISVADIIRALANDSKIKESNDALDAAIAAKAEKPETDVIAEFRKQFNAKAPNLKLSAIFFSSATKDKINFQSSDDEVIAFIRSEAEQSVDRSFKILKTRIDQFGVTQPTVQLLSNSGRVMIELPGVDNPERVRRIIQSTAKLEFWNTYGNFEFAQYHDKINEYLKKQNKLSLLEGDTTAKTAVDTANAATATTATLAGDDSVAKVDSPATEDTSAFAKQDENRDYLGEVGLIRSVTKNEEQNQYMLAEGATIGNALVKDTAKINALLNSPAIKDDILPSDLTFAWENKPISAEVPTIRLYALKAEREGGAALEGDVVTDARPVLDQSGNTEISMSMNLVGANKWKKITAAAAAAKPQKSVAIVLDGYVYSAPTVNGEIPNGQSRIMGNFTQEEAKDLSNILKAGKMPAPARIVEEAVVGPSLGQKAINDGFLSILVGFLAVILIMYLVYNTAGLIADLAVLLNLFFIVGTLASFQAALTLPGIAGIILTLGMAVDANVLIYERIKEELEAGRNLRNAISNGYKSAASAIIDSNVTTALAGIVLAIFGTGPIEGFAITLIIGIICSLFTAFLLTRVVYEWMIKREKHVSFWFPHTKGLLKNANFDFIGKRKIFYICSSIVILAGVVSMATKGFDLGVDFKGGWSYVIDFENPVQASEAREKLSPVLGSAPEVKVYGTGNALKITTTYMINSQDAKASEMVLAKLDEGLKTTGGGKYEILTSYKVGPTVAEDIKQAAIVSIVLALIGMFIYIQIRFKRWQFAVATVVMLLHDVLLVLSFFTLLDGIVPFTLEIDQAFIAAILTIIGYSINDSVVVFDRMREYLNEHKHEGDTSKVINLALNKTLSRTLMTSITTIVVVFILFIFGGETIRGFAFALTTGIIFGTYSSLCIGSPLSSDLMNWSAKKNK
jgi:SecD/SecF fusion protein